MKRGRTLKKHPLEDPAVMKKVEDAVRKTNEHFAILDEINKYSKLVEKYTRMRKDAEQKLLVSCPHTATTKKEDHFPGSYYDREYWVITKKCKTCGKTLSTETTTGGYG
jgi:hypothetical protein